MYYFRMEQTQTKNVDIKFKFSCKDDKVTICNPFYPNFGFQKKVL